MLTLVTGATGFVGSAVARRLIAAGHRVRALVRPGGNRRNLAGLDLELIEGDLSLPESLPPALAGCRYLFHVAADYRLWVPDPLAMFRTNVEGTRALLRAAMRADIERIVYTSSVATLGTLAGAAADETTQLALASLIGPYKRSKYQAEAVVGELLAEGLPAVIVNPAAPVGPRDIKPTPTGRLIVEAARGRVPGYVETGLNVVHVDDVAEGHLLALTRGRIGERYILGGENLHLGDILRLLAGITGQRPPQFRLPHGAVLPIAYLAQGWARLSGREPFVTVDGVKLARKTMFFTSAKAEAELGYRSRPAREALVEAVAWFAQHGYCPPPKAPPADGRG